MKKLIMILISLGLLLPKNLSPAINPKKQVKMILYTGLYGTVVGLSTLSFYKDPSAHKRNIAVGGALGLIAAVAISTVLATKEDKQRIQTELLNQNTYGTTDVKANKEESKKSINKKGEEAKGSDFIDSKKGSSDKNDQFIDEEDDYDEEDDEYEDEEIINKNEDSSVKLLFAEFSNNRVSVNSDFMVFYQNPNNNKIDIYAKVIDFRF